MYKILGGPVSCYLVHLVYGGGGLEEIFQGSMDILSIWNTCFTDKIQVLILYSYYCLVISTNSKVPQSYRIINHY